MTDFSQMMEELKSEYISEMPEKISEIRDLFEKESISELTDEFHKLKGSGKTYGIPEVSELGAIVEKICSTSPSLIPKALPEALELLSKIYNKRSQDAEHSLSDDPLWDNLSSLLKSQ